VDILTPRVWPEITAAAHAATTPSFAAIAYFGAKGDELLPLLPGSSLVVDATTPTVAAGSTCPDALRRLQVKGVRVFSAKHLHAKMIAFDKIAFVGSANASAHSRDTLIEAVVKFKSKRSLSEVRNAITALCRTELTSADLDTLSKIYVPRRSPPKERPAQAKLQTLVMELTLEQGQGRETQVQPPRPVWERYFGIEWEALSLPQLTLLDEANPIATPLRRNIVRHDHNLTIEIAGAEPPRPALLQIRRTGNNAYKYRVIRPIHSEFAHVKALVSSVPNPHWTAGRKWIII
jgi:hypothetical protein